MGEPAVVLASGSPRRSELLELLGITHTVDPADIDERTPASQPPEVQVRRLAEAKAAAVAERYDPTTAVIGADTLVALDTEVLGKPDDEDAAAAMLRRLSGREHRVLTGIAVRRHDELRSEVACTTVRFRSLRDTELAWYLATGEPAGKAGGYALQGAGAALVESIAGCHTTVVGLPLWPTVRLLRTVGIDPLQPATLSR